MQLTIELAPSDPNYVKWRRLIHETVPQIRDAVTYSTVAEALGHMHKFKVRIDHKHGYPTQVLLDFEQDRDYTMFVMRCL